VVTCEIKLFWNDFEIISVFYFTLFPNYFSDIEHVGKCSWAAPSLWNNSEI